MCMSSLSLVCSIKHTFLPTLNSYNINNKFIKTTKHKIFKSLNSWKKIFILHLILKKKCVATINFTQSNQNFSSLKISLYIKLWYFEAQKYTTYETNPSILEISLPVKFINIFHNLLTNKCTSFATFVNSTNKKWRENIPKTRYINL